MRLAGVAAMVVGATLIFFVFGTRPSSSSSSAPGNTIVDPPPAGGGVLNNIVQLAQSQVGKRYLFGASTDPTLTTIAYDCSSLVQSIFERLGFSGVPRTSQAQAASATPVSTPQPGDLVFGSFTSPNDHVGIYVGNGQAVSALDESHGVITTPVGNWPGVHFGRF